MSSRSTMCRYWRIDQEDRLGRYEVSGLDFDGTFTRLRNEGKDDEEIADEVDAALGTIGLM